MLFLLFTNRKTLQLKKNKNINNVLVSGVLLPKVLPKVIFDASALLQEREYTVEQDVNFYYNYRRGFIVNSRYISSVWGRSGVWSRAGWLENTRLLLDLAVSSEESFAVGSDVGIRCSWEPTGFNPSANLIWVCLLQNYSSLGYSVFLLHKLLPKRIRKYSKEGRRYSSVLTVLSTSRELGVVIRSVKFFSLYALSEVGSVYYYYLFVFLLDEVLFNLQTNNFYFLPEIQHAMLTKHVGIVHKVNYGD